MLQRTDVILAAPVVSGVKAVPSMHDDLVPALLMIAKQTRALCGVMLADIDLVAGQDQLLLALDAEQPRVVSELADLLSVRASTVSKMVDRLAEKGFLARLPDERDARRIFVRITPAGVEARERVRTVHTRMGAEIARSFGEDTSGIADQLEQLNRHLSLRLRRLR